MLDTPDFIMKDKRESSASECVCREGERHRHRERESVSRTIRILQTSRLLLRAQYHRVFEQPPSQGSASWLISDRPQRDRGAVGGRCPLLLYSVTPSGMNSAEQTVTWLISLGVLESPKKSISDPEAFLQTSLQDGAVLCRLLDRLRPGTVKVSI